MNENLMMVETNLPATIKNLTLEDFKTAIKTRLQEDFKIFTPLLGKSYSIESKEQKEQAVNQVRILKSSEKKIINSWKEIRAISIKFQKDVKAGEEEMASSLQFEIKLREQKLGAYQLEQEQLARQESECLIKEQTKTAEDAKLKAAQTASESGDMQRAEAILNQPTIVAMPAMPLAEKQKGEAIKRPWEATIFDPIALIKAIAEGKAPIGLTEFKMPEMNKLVTALKIEQPWPGVLARESLKFSVR